MTTLDTSRTAFGTTSAASSFFSRAVAAVVAWNDARVTRKALASLTDRELEDIGLVRGDIDSVVDTDFIR